MKIAVIGAGTMGAGIAQVFATRGQEVILCDLTAEQAEGGKAKVDGALTRLADKGKITEEEKSRYLAHITTGVVENAAGADWVIEAAYEDVSVKRELFVRLDPLCGEGTIFASNTSSISITEMAAFTRHPLIGFHFFNPAPVMELVEITLAYTTPDEVVKKADELAHLIGKTPVHVTDSPGFIVNRVLIPMINEAAFLLYEGVATAEDIDTAMKLGANHPMGPLALGDLIGLDVVLAICEVLQTETGDDKYRPCPLVKKLVRAGRLGRKSGGGFYTY